MIPRPVPAEAPEQQGVGELEIDRPEQPVVAALLVAAHSGRAEPRAPWLELPHRPALRRESAHLPESAP